MFDFNNLVHRRPLRFGGRINLPYGMGVPAPAPVGAAGSTSPTAAEEVGPSTGQLLADALQAVVRRRAVLPSSPQTPMRPRPYAPMVPNMTRGGGGMLADILRAVAAQRMAPAADTADTTGFFPPSATEGRVPWGDWGLPGMAPPDTTAAPAPTAAPDPLAEAERLQAENAAALQQALAESERRSAEDAAATATRREADPGLQYALGLVEQMKSGGMSMPDAVAAYRAQMLNRPAPAAGALPENFGNMPSAPTRPTFSDFGAFRSAVSRRLGGMFGRR